MYVCVHTWVAQLATHICTTTQNNRKIMLIMTLISPSSLLSLPAQQTSENSPAIYDSL